nr:hypothetical protein [Paenibacillus sp. VKM B-2647]
MTTARRRLIDGVRRAQIQAKVAPTVIALTEEAQRAGEL